MAKEFAKSSKISLKFKGRSSKNGDNNGEFDKQEKGKKGFSKKFTKEKTHIRSNPLKVSSLESSKKKFGEKKKKFEDFSGKSSKNLGNNFDKQPNNDDNKYIRKNPLKFSSSESGKNKFGDNRNKFEENSSNVSILRTERKKFGKKNSEDDSVEAKPKKKKRVIKIDCYDFSNKRLDDGNVLNVELSMNAQFRAIKPSPSILTFVEDNLLGRRRDIELRRVGYNTELSAPLDNIPFSTSTDRERIEESVFRNKMEFFAAAKVSSSFPPPDLPEIAFAGRSNVGKSSLLNSLTRQWGVVRTSDKPGHTQSINFFNLGTKLNLVDLPGYGFAYAKEEVKEAWEDLTKYQIVLTKTDTVFPLDVARRAMQIEETLKEHRSIVQPVMMVSSRSGAGIRCLRTALSKIAQFVKP
uniref:EngB-type G domain-containing protein n=1 Tax=Chenopodium quinoa TaxID=63459 RepID=A0A803L158_CHEQI